MCPHTFVCVCTCVCVYNSDTSLPKSFLPRTYHLGMVETQREVKTGETRLVDK